MADSSLLLRQLLPDHVPTSTPLQQAFRQAIRTAENLREQLQALRTAQAAARQAYWQQVGPLAAATVASRRALYEPLEMALTAGYLSRAEEKQVTELLLRNALSLQMRFGEDEAASVARYSAASPATDLMPTPSSVELPPYELAAAAAQARRQQQQQQAREAQAKAADTAGQALLQNTKAVYRQLARLHHPDRAAQASAAAQQTQTALMQRITAAYAAGDLAGLLALLADEEASAPPTVEAEELLQRYTQALVQQQAQLSQQLAQAQRPLEDAPWSGTEKQQRTRLRQIKRDLRAESEYLGFLLAQLREPASLRNLLRELTAAGQQEI